MKIIIHGKVQGVFFRKTIYQHVQKSLPNLQGYIENRQDGTVFVLAEGDSSQLRLLLDFCYAGSSASKVEHIEFSENEDDDLRELSAFHIAY